MSTWKQAASARTESGEERASLTPARFPTQEFSEALREEVVGRYKSWVFVSGKELQVAVDSKTSLLGAIFPQAPK